MKKSRKFLAVLLTVCICITAVILPASAYEPDFEVPADEGVFLMSLDTGQVLYEQNADKQMAPASMTKVMSTIVALENCQDLGEMVTAPSYIYDEFVGINVSTAGISPGEQLSVKDLLYCMMLQSANEAASIIADHFGGSIESFAEMMNKKAAELGCTNTHFVNPHGLDADGHYTSPRDMATIAQYALGVNGFRDICTSTRYTLPQTNIREEQVVVTTILMQDEYRGGDLYNPYIKGIKTGTTDNAGRCFVSTYQRDGENLLLVVMNAPNTDDDDNQAFTQTQQFYDWAHNNFDLETLVEKGSVLHEVKIKQSFDTDVLILTAASDVTLLLPSGADKTAVQYVATLDDEEIVAPVKKGDKIGKMTLKLGGETIGEVDMLAEKDVKGSTILKIADAIHGALSSTAAKIILVLVILFILVYILFVIRSINLQKKKGKIKRHKKYKL